MLRDAVDLYVYTSSTGVYYPYLGADLAEDTRLVLEAPEEANEDLAYGVMKTQSELEARRAFGDDRTIVVRPTYIAGPGDTSNRFPYWPVRIERGGRILVPGHADDPVQYVDVRDLAEFMIHLVETRAAGTYNVAGPASRLGMHAFVHGVHAAVSSPVEWVPVPDYDFLVEHGVPYVVPWIMPVDDNFGSARVNASRAVAAGLAFRPLAVTVRDTLDWWHSGAVPDVRKARLTDDPEGLMAREASILDAWAARSTQG
jgi:2'-hydroxyisoflavone reductase